MKEKPTVHHATVSQFFVDSVPYYNVIVVLLKEDHVKRTRRNYRGHCDSY